MLPMLMGAILSGVGSAFSNAQSAREAQNARNQNFILNEWAAANADQRARALYQDLQSPEALLEQYREAGLSPSLMLGNGGGVSGHLQPGQQGAGAAGPQTQMFGYDLLTGAQAALALAQADKVKAETKQIEPMATATIADLLADAGYKDAAGATERARAAGITLDNYVKENTKDASIFTICELADKVSYETEKAYYEMKDAKLLNDFNTETFEDRKKIVHEQLNSIVQSIAESKSCEALNYKQKSYLQDQILKAIDDSARAWQEYELSVEQFETFLEKQIPILQKQLEIQLKDLDIRNKKLVIDAITESFKALAMGAVAASSAMGGKYGKGGYTGPAEAAQRMPKQVVHTPNKTGVPPYKTSTIWDQ